MPDRYLRSAILNSNAVNALSANAELFYRRLMSVVDDFGRFEADPSDLLPACFPKQLTTRQTDISRWLAECEKAGVVLLYEADCKRFLWFLKTDPPRAKSSKYPPHPSDARPCIIKRAHADSCAHVRPYASSDSISLSSPPNPPRTGARTGEGRGGGGRKSREEQDAARLAMLERHKIGNPS